MSVVQLADMKAHLNITFGTDDALIQGKIDAAEKHIEQFTGRALLTQARTVHFDCFSRCLELPVLPVQSITSVTYLDTAQAEQTLAAGSYIATPLNSADDPTFLYPASGTFWPRTAAVKAAVTVTLQAGYGAAADVPAPFIEAIKQLVAHWYENREAALISVTSSELPFALQDFLNEFRTWVF